MASAADKSNRTILVVDDELDNRLIYSEILSDLGYNVIDKPDGASALSAVREGASVDLVIADYRMPEMNGLEFIVELRQMLPSVPVIMVTAYASIENYFQSLSLGVFEYVNKPVAKREFERVVKAALDRRETDAA
jgi:CheY-like chemotaxis protein